MANRHLFWYRVAGNILGHGLPDPLRSGQAGLNSLTAQAI